MGCAQEGREILHHVSKPHADGELFAADILAASGFFSSQTPPCENPDIQPILLKPVYGLAAGVWGNSVFGDDAPRSVLHQRAVEARAGRVEAERRDQPGEPRRRPAADEREADARLA